jgi:hypothetical protein
LEGKLEIKTPQGRPRRRWEDNIKMVLREIAGSACYLLHAGFLLGFFFDPEEGGDMFLRNVG